MSDLEIRSSESSQNSPPSSATPEFSAATQPSYARTLFVGPDGLRAGWGFAFYVVMFFALQRIAVELAWARDFGFSGLWSWLLEEFGNFLAAVIPSVVLCRIERRRWRAYGLPARDAFGTRFWQGLSWGIGAITLLMVALYGAHCFHFGHLAVHGLRAVRFAAFWAVMFLFVGLFEEFLLRGYTQFTLARGLGFWPAAIALSSAFGLIHLRNGGEQWPGLLAAAFIGLFFCLTLRRTGTLWFAVGFHAAWDWGESFLYSVPDSGMLSPGHLLSSSLRGPAWLSGGSVGPEGSVLCFVVIAATWILFDRTHRQGTYQNES
ncbi:MAG TPA: type II CAAX endopeptidase family protein [Candidatus Eisenbacteria bacterium]|nr:type II CAAX endopeptidase family protein [Candidatus Eisenbacteria bacterium]